MCLPRLYLHKAFEAALERSHSHLAVSLLERTGNSYGQK